MKNKNIIMMILGLIILVGLMNLGSSEVWMWSQTNIDNSTNTVNYHIFYSLEDTSDALITIQRPVPIELLANVQNLPYNISSYYPQFTNALVDWCNYTIQIQRNEYDTSLQGFPIINTSIEYFNIFFENTNATYNISQYELRARDSLVGDMTCHYTNTDSLFFQNVYFGFITTYLPAYECTGCADHTFEDLVKANDHIADNINANAGDYALIQNIVTKNFLIWNIVSWLLKIGLIIMAFGLTFVVFYYVYELFKSFERKIR